MTERRILYRIILPFSLLFAVTSLMSWLFSTYFITKHLDRSLKNQMVQVADIISKSSYVLNPAILGQIKGIVNSDIVLFDAKRRILSATFSDPAIREHLFPAGQDVSARPFSGRDVTFQGVSYRTVTHSFAMPKKGRVFLSLWMPASDADFLKKKIILSTGGIALFGILAMAALGYLIARGITAPVEQLVRAVERVSGGDFKERIRLQRKDEIGRLAGAFNEMTRQLKAYEDKLVESEKLAAAGQMAAGLAHEVRNPMTSIKMLGQVLSNRLKSQTESREMLHSLVKEIDRLDRIIQEIINRTHPGELHRKWEDLNRQVQEVMALARNGPAGQKIITQENLAENLPEVYLDAEKFKQVLWNLVLNAKEAMPKGGRLTVATAMGDDGRVRLCVADTGQGIADTESERYFQPFFTTKAEGMGLGLAMSRKIIQKHGGALTLENRPEGGASAVVLLPVGAGK